MVLKYFLISILLSASLYASSYIMLSGIAVHGDSNNKATGRKYDTVIEGVGYQYRQDFWSATVMAIMDSNSNFQPSFTLGGSYPIVSWLRIGAELGFASRVVYGMDIHGEWAGTQERQPVLIALPKLEIDLDRVMVNLTYMPQIDTSGLYVSSFLYINLGIKI